MNKNVSLLNRYKQLPHKPSQCEGNLKKLLLYCKDLRLQYQIARELGLKDFLSQLETGHNSAYIMDIAASRGSAHFAFWQNAMHPKPKVQNFSTYSSSKNQRNWLTNLDYFWWFTELSKFFCHRKWQTDCKY